MCRRLVGAGFAVNAFDVDAAALDAAVRTGAGRSDSAASCAADCDVLLTSLPRPDHVESVMRDDGALRALSAGSIWVDLTTNRRTLLESLMAEAPNGVDIVDAPVTGAVDGARNGTLTVFVGGEAEPVGRVTPILETLGKVMRCGPLGSGNVVKLITNQLWFIHAAALGEAFATGLQNGVDIETIWLSIKNSVADSFVARHDAPSIFAGHYDPSFTLDLCMKDLDLIREMTETVDAPLPMTAAAREAFTIASERYGPDAPELFVAKRIEDDAGVSMRLDGDWTPHWEK